MLYRDVKIKPPPLRSKISGFWGRFYFLQNPDLEIHFFSPEGFIFYKILKIFRALRAEGFIFYKIYCQNRPIFERFLDRFRPNNSQKTLKIFARFARRVLGFQKISRASRGEVIFFTKSFRKIPRFARDVIFFTKSPKIFSRAKRGRYYFLQKSLKIIHFGFLTLLHVQQDMSWVLGPISSRNSYDQTNQT